MDADLRNQVDEAITDFAAAAERLKIAPNEDAAEEACLACRAAVQLFFFAREEYRGESPEKAQELVDALGGAAASMKELAADLGDRHRVRLYLESVQHRAELVDAVMQGNAMRIRDVLQEGWEAAQLSAS